MFGYLAPALGALTEEQKNRYRAFYCGLCHALKSSGEISRISLSHDMTFLAILLSSLLEPEETCRTGRCAVHPMHSHPWIASSPIQYAADMNILLFYYKCVDSGMDEHSLRARFGLNRFSRFLGPLQEKYPDQCGSVEAALRELWQLEKAPEAPADRLCNLSGQMLGAVFVPDRKLYFAPVLQALGESLGRFVYWMDAWEDYEEDIRKGRFNPLVPWHGREDYETFCHDTLEMFLAEAVSRFEVLPLVQDTDILRNILYAGVWQRYQRKLKHSKEVKAADE